MDTADGNLPTIVDNKTTTDQKEKTCFPQRSRQRFRGPARPLRRPQRPSAPSPSVPSPSQEKKVSPESKTQTTSSKDAVFDRSLSMRHKAKKTPFKADSIFDRSKTSHRCYLGTIQLCVHSVHISLIILSVLELVMIIPRQESCDMFLVPAKAALLGGISGCTSLLSLHLMSCIQPPEKDPAPGSTPVPRTEVPTRRTRFRAVLAGALRTVAASFSVFYVLSALALASTYPWGMSFRSDLSPDCHYMSKLLMLDIALKGSLFAFCGVVAHLSWIWALLTKPPSFRWTGKDYRKREQFAGLLV